MAELASVFEQGGWVSYALTVVSVLLWAGVWVRLGALTPQRLARFEAQASLLDNPKRRAILLERTAEELAAWKSPIRVLVLVAPLLGLLGTVSGMVEMFDSLHGGGAVVREGSVAGGISTALITTQLGLVIGVPGLVAARLLDRRQVRLEGELQRRLRVLEAAS